MNEQRLALYIDLIQKLLQCPNGDKPAILQAHRHLLDEEFVQTVLMAAQEMPDGNIADFLRDLAAQVSAALGLGLPEGREITEAALTQFWLQLLLAEEESGGDAAAVHRVMEQNLSLITPELGRTVVNWVQAMVAQEPGQVEAIAAVVENTCTSIQQFPHDKYGEVLAIAIQGYGAVLTLSANNPERRARALHNQALARRIQAELGIDPAANLERAIAAYEESAQIKRQLGLARDLSQTLNNQATARVSQAELGIDPAANLERAIAAYEESAQIMRQLGLERDLSTTLNNQANARLRQANLGIDPAANLERAIAAYNLALQVYTREAFPEQWASTMMNLATAYSERMQGDRQDNLKQAIDTYQQALTVFTRRAHPLKWATIQKQLGQLHRDPSLKYYERAVQILEEAYQFLLERKFDLVLLADVMFQLAETYHIIGQLEQARLLLKDVLRLYQRTNQSQKATATLATLGNLEMQMGRIAQATQHLQSALATYQSEGRTDRVTEVEKLLSFLPSSVFS